MQNEFEEREYGKYTLPRHDAFKSKQRWVPLYTCFPSVFFHQELGCHVGKLPQ
jgi:hypothetical protein